MRISPAVVEGIAATPTDGWVEDTSAWTRTSDQTFTIVGNLTVRYSKGTRLKWTQNSIVKYGTVIDSSHSAGTTTITIATTTDYVITSGQAISATYYSYAVNPQGYPQWFAYTPSWTTTGTAPSLGNGALNGSFQIVGRIVHCKVLLVMGSTTTFGTGNYNITPPVTEDGTNSYVVSPGLAFDNSAGAFHATQHRLDSFYNFAAPAVFLSNTSPFTWAQSDQLMYSKTYRY